MAKRLTEDEWSALKADWVTGAYSDQQLADKYGNSKQAISKKARLEGWVKADKDKIAEVVKTRQVVKSSQKVVKEVVKDTKVHEKHFDDAIDTLADIKTEVMSGMLDLAKKTKEVQELCATPAELRDCGVVYKNIYEPLFKEKSVQIANNNAQQTNVTAEISGYSVKTINE